MKKYRIIATEIDTETNEEKELLNDEYEGFTIYGDHGEKFSEVMINENIMGLASKIAQSSRGKIAAKLANVLNETKSSFMTDMEDDLIDMMMNGGGNNERI